MAAAVVYTNFGGMLVHENRGGVETEYVNDTLGSLVECRDTSGTKTYEATYWPYGEIRTSTGTNPSPWAFVGLLGYLRESASRTYVRARYYRQEIARWMTVDPLWPEEAAYGYSIRPNENVDPSGMWIVPFLCFSACVGAGGCFWGLHIACKDWRGAYNSFEECAMEYIRGLPIHSIVGCAASIVGCIVCLLKNARSLCRRLFDGRCTRAEWDAWDELIHNKNSCDGKRSCDNILPPPSAAKCAEIDRRIQNGINCVAARLGRMIACIKSDYKREEHQGEITKATTTLWACQAKRVKFRCP